MQREFLINKLEAYRPLEKEGYVQTEILNFVREYSNCFDRELEIGHITGSAWLVDTTGERALLTHHKKLNRWMQLGGHSDGDPNTMAVALKEAQEESGINDIHFLSEEVFDIDVHQIPARENEKAHYHFDVRFLLQTKNDNFSISDESNDLRWFNRDELSELNLEESVKRMIEKWAKL